MRLLASPARLPSVGSPAPSIDEATRHALRGSFYRGFGKRMLDLGLVLLLLPIVLPVILVVALTLLIGGHSPFYIQKRLGFGGREFRLWKFQTMYPDADRMLDAILARDPVRRAEWQSTQKLKDDPRITPMGHFLRRTSIDELPQFWNVLRGDMSLLGPRPMLPDQKELYGAAFPVYASLRPGISGAWQVSDRNDAHFHRRAESDVAYARDLSFALDLRLVLQTVRTVLRSTGY